MKKMNKLTAAVLAAAMIGSMAMPALATDVADKTMTGGTANNLAQSGKTKLSYTIPESYSWSIPADITFTENNDSAIATGNVKVTNCYINANNTLTIKIAPLTSSDTETGTENNAFVLDSQEGAKFTYKVEKTSSTPSAELAKDDAVLTVASGTNTETQNLTFTLTSGQNGQRQAGTYTGYVKFSASVAATNP